MFSLSFFLSFFLSSSSSLSFFFQSASSLPMFFWPWDLTDLDPFFLFWFSFKNKRDIYHLFGSSTVQGAYAFKWSQLVQRNKQKKYILVAFVVGNWGSHIDIQVGHSSQLSWGVPQISLKIIVKIGMLILRLEATKVNSLSTVSNTYLKYNVTRLKDLNCKLPRNFS